MLRKEVPKATGRRSPSRRQLPKPKRKGAVLERGILDDDILEATKAVDRFKRENNRPFPALSEIIAVLRSLGYSKKHSAIGPESAAADVAEMRESFAEAIKELRRSDMKRNLLACELHETRKNLRESTIQSSKRKRALAAANDKIGKLQKTINKSLTYLLQVSSVEVPDRNRMRQIRKEITRLAREEGTLFAADGVTAVQIRQVEVEADVAVVVKAVAKSVGAATRTLEHGKER